MNAILSNGVHFLMCNKKHIQSTNQSKKYACECLTDFYVLKVATRATESTATKSTTRATEATTVSSESAAVTTLTVAALTVHLLRLEHAQQLLGSENAGEFCAVFLLDVQTELLLLDLFGLTGKLLIELCSSFLVCEVLFFPVCLTFAVLLGPCGSHLFEIAGVDGIKLCLLFVGELQVFDESLRLTGLHFLEPCGAVVIVLGVCVGEEAKKHGNHCEEFYVSFHNVCYIKSVTFICLLCDHILMTDKSQLGLKEVGIL